MKDGENIFAQTFWKNDGKTVEQKPQNPIAGQQALYNQDSRKDKVSLAQGMVFNDMDRVRIFDPKKNAWYNSEEEAMKNASDIKQCEVFKNSEGKLFHSPAVWIAHRRAIDSFRNEQFGDDISKNPVAYGTPLGPLFKEALNFDGEDIYGDGQYNEAQTISFQTLGMASGYRHLALPVLNSVRSSIGLPAFENIVMGTNFYGAYPATFEGKNIHRYRYMDDNGDFDLNSFKKAVTMFDRETTIYLFDMSTGNNFVGTKRTELDNENIVQVIIDKQLYSEHDIAYPNYDPDFDPAFELYRLLQKAGVPHGVQSSRGKKDKYASRLAFHHIFMGAGDQKKEIISHLISENRSRFLAMPDTWTYLVEIARDPVLKAAHISDNSTFVDIVNASRKNLAEELGWDWMKRRYGMFDMVNISHEGVKKMAEDYAIYTVPSRNQNIVGDDGLPVGVTRIKHGIPVSKIPNVADALRDAAEKYPSEQGTTNPDIVIGS